MKLDPLPYFAYGSNMNLGQMGRRCPGATLLGTARLDGYRFVINETGYATIERFPGRHVEGVLWNLLAEHHPILDEYEDHLEGGYDRCWREVFSSLNKAHLALVYIDHLRTRPSSPNPGYLEAILEGAIANGLSPDYIGSLREFERLR